MTSEISPVQQTDLLHWILYWEKSLATDNQPDESHNDDGNLLSSTWSLLGYLVSELIALTY